MMAEIITSSLPRDGNDHVFGGWAKHGFTNWSKGKRALDAKIKIAPWRIHHIRRSVATHIARNDEGRYRVAGIDVELIPTVSPTHAVAPEPCEDIFGDYCTAIEGAQQVSPVNVSVKKIESNVTAKVRR